MQTDNSSAEQMCRSLNIDWHSSADAQALASVLSKQIAHWLEQAIKQSGKASLVVSGGSTPVPLFRALSAIPIDWSSVEITLADERWVPDDHADSNERLVRTELMVDQAATARFVPLYVEGKTPMEAVEDVEQQLATMSHPYTVVILGMGGDGHTASLFPDAPEDELAQAMDPDSAAEVTIQQPPSVPQIRISLTRAALLRSDHRVLHISGNGKREVLAEALNQALDRSEAQCQQQSPNQSPNHVSTQAADEIAHHTRPGNDQPAPSAAYAPGMKPVIGLLTTRPENASVYWSP